MSMGCVRKGRGGPSTCGDVNFFDAFFLEGGVRDKTLMWWAWPITCKCCFHPSPMRWPLSFPRGNQAFKSMWWLQHTHTHAHMRACARTLTHKHTHTGWHNWKGGVTDQFDCPGSAHSSHIWPIRQQITWKFTVTMRMVGHQAFTFPEQKGLYCLNWDQEISERLNK